MDVCRLDSGRGTGSLLPTRASVATWKAKRTTLFAQFTDVAAEAGLREILIYGGLKKKNYIIETVGCGVAFLDYDNDGWLDIFLLSGTRMDNPPPRRDEQAI